MTTSAMRINSIIALNGPPLVGKTLIANELRRIDPTLFEIVSPAELLRDAITCLAFEGDFLTHDLTTAEIKDSQLPCITREMTVRQALCELSNLVRSWDPLFLSRRCALTARKLIDNNICEYVIYDNAGIPADLEGLLEVFNESEITLVKVSRDGCEFNDTLRTNLDSGPLDVLEVVNNDTITEAASQILTRL